MVSHSPITRPLWAGFSADCSASNWQKKSIGENASSGDLFTLPIILGIAIGRIGCFLSGIKEFTYGRQTSFFLGMDLGDGMQRHPIALYEIIFLVILFNLIQQWQKRRHSFKSGTFFKIFMLAYFAFRFFIEFLKPNAFLVLGMSSIQILCLICMAYYHRTLRSFFTYVRKKLYLL